MKARLPLTLAGLVAALPLPAAAQEWVSNPDVAEGIGIRAGNLELHPSLGGEFGYDSNYNRAADSENPVDVLRLRITPSFSVRTLGRARRGPAASDIEFQAGAFLAYNQLWAVDSENDEVNGARFGAGANGRLDIFPARPLGADLSAGYLRTVEPDSSPDDVGNSNFDRDTVRGAAGVTWRPGGGLFEWRVGYGVTYNFFEEDQYRTFNNLQHEINMRGRWRFLPRSALLYDGAYSFVRYRNDTQQTDGDSVRARFGFHGLVTYKLALLGMLGWASSFYEGHGGSIAPRQYDSLIANAEVRWFLMKMPDLETAQSATGLSWIALGYTRNFANSYYGSFYQRDRGYLQFNMFLLGAVAGGIEVGLSRVAYPEVQVGDFQQDAFTQTRVDARLFAEYRFTDTIATNLTVKYDQTDSPTIANDDLSYDRWQAYIGLRWFM